MATLRYSLILLCALGVAGCQPSAETKADEPAADLMGQCNYVNRLFEQMKAADSSFTYDQDGNATMSGELWNSIPPALRDGLMKALAYNAICASGTVGQQTVTVRATGTNEILAQETIEDPSRANAR